MQPPHVPPHGQQLPLLLVWESEVIPAGENAARVVARKPLSRMSVAQAARVLGCSEWTVRKLYRVGALRGYKPGAAMERRDGRASNASLMIDAESVLLHKSETSRRA